ncbi:hypothetical protein [Zhouia amylolytica]|uniref:hypothetical protein n=1 Tax=Zhouia amylolytica TaxID=376730 RepID=UPI0020CFE7EA|nr:hypothetical protein [Zhouia amylolytica]MCQ0112645.1 hypothetical protein [Zhouia amylolytica]
MSTILTVFGLIAQNEGITISALEKQIGASKGVLSRALKNKTDIQTKWLAALVENYPNYNPSWILMGKGPMFKSQTPDDLHPIAEDSSEYQLREKITVLEERIAVLKEANEALKESNATLKELKLFLEKRISDLEGE